MTKITKSFFLYELGFMTFVIISGAILRFTTEVLGKELDLSESVHEEAIVMLYFSLNHGKANASNAD